jgi:hypothetical protein
MYANEPVGSMKRFMGFINQLMKNGYENEIRNLLQGHGSGAGITLFVPSNEVRAQALEILSKKAMFLNSKCVSIVIINRQWKNQLT